jgi:hypothetical protein
VVTHTPHLYGSSQDPHVLLVLRREIVPEHVSITASRGTGLSGWQVGFFYSDYCDRTSHDVSLFSIAYMDSLPRNEEKIKLFPGYFG